MMNFKKIGVFLQAHLLLIIAGVVCEVFYLFYFVRQFPLLSHYEGLTDMEGLQGHTHAAFAAFIIVMSIVFAFFGLAWWESYKYHDQGTLWLILGFGALFAGTMVFVYPGTAIDIFDYITQSIVLVLHHANPMVTPPSAYPDDPLMKLAGGWASTPAPYGPLGLLIDAIPTAIFGRNLLANLLLLKFMFSACILMNAFLAYKILAFYAPRCALAGALFICWNPQVLFEYSANSHNDIVLMLFVLLAVLALVKGHHVGACALLVASILIKYATLSILPLFLIYSIWQQPTHSKRVIYFLQAGIVTLLLMILYLPFWSGPDTVRTILQQDGTYISSFATLVFDASAMQISFDQGKMIGRVIFGCVYLYALFLSTRSLPDMLRGCFLTLFFILAVASAKFEVWYLIWPVALAVLTARKEHTLAAFLLTYGASLSAAIYGYIWGWLVDNQSLTVIQAMAYLISFAPALLLLCCSTLKQFSSALYKHSQV